MLPYLLLSLNLLTIREVPAGTRLHVRLTTAVGSYGSKVGTPVSAILIAPVLASEETILPEGSILAGKVKSVRRVGFGIMRETAALTLEFSQVTLPDGRTFPVAARLTQVDNSRERVSRDGGIHGVRTTSSLSYRVSGYVRTVLSWQVEAALATWAIKTLLVQVPEPEIYYPAGVEMTLALTGPMLSTPQPPSEEVAQRLTTVEREELRRVLDEMPYRTYARSSNRPSDLVNMMFIGSSEQIAAAFTAAGWTETTAPTLRSRITNIRAVAESRGFHAAPMSSLLLNDTEADVSWQKGLNDIAKRHHIRMWKQSATWQGQAIWIGAATRDVDFAFMRPGQAVTHKIENDIDLERDKIAHDLKFTFCADVVDWWDRPEVPHVTRNATGDLMTTDARVVVIRMNDCREPRLSTQTIDTATVRPHGNKVQRFLRREIMSARSDLIRDNVYWRGYEGVRWMITTIHGCRRPAIQDSSRAPAQLAENMQRPPGIFSRDRMGWLW